MEHLKNLFKILKRINLHYCRYPDSNNHTLRLDIKDKDNVGGELSIDFNGDNGPTVKAKLGCIKDGEDLKMERCEW